MKLKINTCYIALTDSENGRVKIGDRIEIRKDFTDSNYFSKYGIAENTNYYTVFLPPIEGDNFFGMAAMNKCEYFQNISDIEEFLKGCEIGYNMDLVNQRISYHQKKIDKIKKQHEIL
jgi:hypothetical protein